MAAGEVPERTICLAIAIDEIRLGIQSTILIILKENTFNRIFNSSEFTVEVISIVHRKSSNRKSFNPLTVNIIVDLFNYSRRETSEVNIGATPMGGSNPIRIQSMTNTATQDTEASVAQTKRIVDAGGEYVRLTAQGIKEAENLMNINIGLRQDGYMVPLVADIHFNPKVADVAAQYVEKVRINPGNYVDAARTFKHLEYTDEEYAQ